MHASYVLDIADHRLLNDVGIKT